MSLEHVDREKQRRETAHLEAMSKELVTQMSELFTEDGMTLEDGRETKAYFDTFKIVEVANLLLTAIAIFVSSIQYELEFDERNEFQSKVLLWVVFISSMMLVILTPIRYYALLRFKKKRNLIPPTATIWSTGHWKPMLIELIICGVHPSPFLYGKTFEMYTMYDNRLIVYHVNDVLGMLLFFRIYAIFKIIMIRTYWFSNRAQRLCELYDCEADFLFVIKCYMRQFPVRSIFVGYFLSVPIFAYWLRISERPYSRVDGQLFNFDSYLSAMWNVIITIGTIGYGDYFAVTIFGRFFIFFVCIWGTSVTSLMVVSMTRVLELTYQEGKAYNLLQRLRTKIDMRNESAFIFTQLIRYRNSFRQGGNPEHRTKADEAMEHLKVFKGMSRYYKALGEEGDSTEMLGRQLDNLKDQMSEINECTKYLKRINMLFMNVLGVDTNVEEKVGHIDSRKALLTIRSFGGSKDQIPSRPRLDERRETIRRSESRKATMSPDRSPDRSPTRSLTKSPERKDRKSNTISPTSSLNKLDKNYEPKKIKRGSFDLKAITQNTEENQLITEGNELITERNVD